MGVLGSSLPTPSGKNPIGSAYALVHLLRQEGGGHSVNEAGGAVLVRWRVRAIRRKSPWAGQTPHLGYESNNKTISRANNNSK